MGIPGLISAIGSGDRIALSKLAIAHLERTSRPIRIAIDISIWLFQVQAGRGGQNPELRTLFYRLLKLLALPIHPLFVYDGKHKPPFKRGKTTRGSYGSAPLIRLSKNLIDLFKFPRHDAPGEAEAECARLQRAGVVDAVMSNDVDALMFGSTIAVLNFSKESSRGSRPATHVTYYRTEETDSLSPNVSLSRAGMILFAMLSGGDYLPSGIPKCGSKLAAQIAKAGFGDDLLEILDSDDAEADLTLNEWKDRLQFELDENESGYFQRKHKAVKIPDTFPDRTILSYYAKPVVSTAEEVKRLRQRLSGAWDREIDALQIRIFAGDAFDWKYRSGANKTIRQLAEPLVSYRLRLGKPILAEQSYSTSVPNRVAPNFQRVYKSRSHFSTDGISQLQFEIVPVDVVGLDLDAEEPNPLLQGETTNTENEGDPHSVPDQAVQKSRNLRQTPRYDPYKAEKVWVFETLAEIGVPDIVGKWRQCQIEKAVALKKTASKKTTTRRKKPIDPGMKPGSILQYTTVIKPRSKSNPTRSDVKDL